MPSQTVVAQLPFAGERQAHLREEVTATRRLGIAAQARPDADGKEAADRHDAELIHRHLGLRPERHAYAVVGQHAQFVVARRADVDQREIGAE